MYNSNLLSSGLSLKETSSGQKKERNTFPNEADQFYEETLNKLVQHLLERILSLFNCIIYTTEREIPLTKIISINAIIRKFVYILMALVKHKDSFGEEKAIRESCILSN